jgi:hypothetical protein
LDARLDFFWASNHETNERQMAGGFGVFGFVRWLSVSKTITGTKRRRNR